MFKRIFQIIVIIIVFFLFNNYDLKAITKSKDQMSLSGPATWSDHEINFRINDNIPADGKIEIIFDKDFYFSDDLNFDDFDFATSDNIDSGFINESLASSSSFIKNGVFISTSTENNKIMIKLDSSSGIAANKFVKIKIGKNASYEKISTSTNQIKNPINTGSYPIEIKTYNQNNDFLERSRIKVFIIKPVTMHSYTTKKRSGASPVGWLGYGTTETILSLYSNFRGICRYSTATGTLFADMSNEFSYDASSTGEYYHTVLIEGLNSGGEYNFYVRCMDEFGIADDYTECKYEVASTSPFTNASGTPILEQDCIDMPIIFSISSIEGSTGDYTGEGGSDGDEGSSSGQSTSSGGGGSGGGAGGGVGRDRGRERGKFLPFPPPPGEPGIILEGWSYNTSMVNVMQDGVQIGWTNAAKNGKFGVYIEELKRGIYTFGVWTNDTQNRKSPTYSTTFWIEQGTLTTVADIIIPPTIDYASSSDRSINVFGYAAPDAEIEIWIYSKKNGEINESEVIKYKTKANGVGKWSYNLDFLNLDKGQYNIKARISLADVNNPSEFSNILLFNVNSEKKEVAEVEQNKGTCADADLNQDGKVNITDFSILLYHWGTDDSCSDQNASGNVDLVDFSIMMYYWTG